MRRNKWLVVGLFALLLVLSGCGESPVELAPIAGKWVHHSEQDQDWTYEFPNDYEVRFAIDGQGAEWSITAIHSGTWVDYRDRCRRTSGDWCPPEFDDQG